MDANRHWADVLSADLETRALLMKLSGTVDGLCFRVWGLGMDEIVHRFIGPVPHRIYIMENEYLAGFRASLNPEP